MRAKRSNPGDPWAFGVDNLLAGASFRSGDYEAAAHWATLALRSAPHLQQPRMTLALACVGLGKVEEARQLAAQVRRAVPGYFDRVLAGSLDFRPAIRQRYRDFARIAIGEADPPQPDATRSPGNADR